MTREHMLSSRMTRMLESAGYQPVESGSCSWDLTLKNGVLLETQARVEGEWLCLESGVDALSKHSPWELLSENARLLGGVKIIHQAGGGSARLRTDIPLSANGEMHGLLAQQGRRLLAAASALAHPDTQTPAGAGEPETLDLEAACETSGWSFRRGLDGSVVVALGERSRTFRARLAIDPAGGFRGSVPIAKFDELDSCSREAIGHLLLAASARVPLVRAVATAGEGHELSLEASIPDLAGTGIDLLCSALWLGCRLCGEEAAALGDATLAKAFLERGHDTPCPDNNTKGVTKC